MRVWCKFISRKPWSQKALSKNWLQCKIWVLKRNHLTQLTVFFNLFTQSYLDGAALRWMPAGIKWAFSGNDTSLKNGKNARFTAILKSLGLCDKRKIFSQMYDTDHQNLCMHAANTFPRSLSLTLRHSHTHAHAETQKNKHSELHTVTIPSQLFLSRSPTQ